MITDRLFKLQDESYRAFQCRLMPTVDEKAVIGVRTPLLRNLAKEIAGTRQAEEFIKKLPHDYYEENNLHAFIIEKIKDYDRCVAEVSRFLPYVNNWATCDLMSPKVFKKHLTELSEQIDVWLASGDVYTVRFGIEMLMSFYLDAEFKPEYLAKVAAVRSEEYYVRMIVAWYFATALAKQYRFTVPYLENRVLDPWTHNKTIGKAVESYRVTQQHKEYLRTLRIPRGASPD